MSRPILIVPGILVATPAAALVVATPGAFRLAGGQVEFFEAWLAVAGLLCPLLALLIASSRATYRAVRPIWAANGWALVSGAALWAVIALPATAAFGAFLKVNTHHRALAGAAFASAALIVQIAAAVVAWRITSLTFARMRNSPTKRATALLISAAALVLLAATLTSVAFADDPEVAASSAVHIPALVVDGMLLLAATAAGASLDVHPHRASDASWLGGGALVFIMSVGTALAWRSPSIAANVTTLAPPAGAVAQALGLSADH